MASGVMAGGLVWCLPAIIALYLSAHVSGQCAAGSSGFSKRTRDATLLMEYSFQVGSRLLQAGRHGVGMSWGPAEGHECLEKSECCCCRGELAASSARAVS